MEKYRGFEIRHPQGGVNRTAFIIFKDGVQFSWLSFGSYMVAKKVIDRYLNSSAKEEFSQPEPEILRTVGNYSNKGYLSIQKED